MPEWIGGDMGKILSTDEVAAKVYRKVAISEFDRLNRRLARAFDELQRYRIALEEIAQRGCDSVEHPPYADTCADFGSRRCPSCIAREALDAD